VIAGSVISGSVISAAPARAQDSGEESAAATSPSIYRWIDENGIAHYTTELDRIPSALRGRATSLGSRSADAAPPANTTQDLWVSRDRGPASAGEIRSGGDFGDEGFDAGDPEAPVEPLDPELAAAQQEERAVAEFDLDLRIAELESVIQDDEESLKVMISDPDSGGPLASADNAEFRTIAMRLPGRLQELQTLRDERASMDDDSADAGE